MLKQSQVINHKIMNILHTALLFGGMLLLLAIIGYAVGGTTGLFWTSAVGLLFLIFGQQMSPQWVLRMHKGRPLHPHEAPRLYQIVQALTRRAKLAHTPHLYLIPNDITNAFTVGTGDQAVIGITAGLLRHLNDREMVGVLAHEISHIKHNDMRVMGFAAMINRMTSLFAGIGQFLLFINLPLLLAGRATISWLLIILLMAAPMLSGLLQLALSRTREFDADLSAVRLTGDAIGMAQALQKLEYAQANMIRLLLPGYRAPESDVFRTHPNMGERIERIMKVAVELPRREWLPPNQAVNPNWYITSGLHS